MESLIGVIISACMVIPLVAASIGIDRKRAAILWTLLFLGLVILDQVLLYLPLQTGINSDLGLHWNWFGKLFVLAWAIPFIAFGPISLSDAGLRKPPQPTIARATAVVAVLAIVAFLIHWYTRTGEPQAAETILYQLIMPAIAEEMVFRGVLFAVLQKAFREQSSADPHWWKSRAVWLTAIAFALMHGWADVNGALEFNALACIFPFVFGVIAGALRKYSGSVVFPIALHSAVNVAAAIFP
ncbi:MAG: lysostaphin resistance A-like protein [Rhodanobacteraceae bacterium]